MRNCEISVLSEIDWPGIVGPQAAGLLALQYQLDQTQYWSTEEIVESQFAQLQKVAAHSSATVPFYAQRFGNLPHSISDLRSPQTWLEIPLLTRRDIQMAGNSLHSTKVPSMHGKVSASITSGSTSEPVVTLGTEISRLFWNAITLRDHVWHRRDYRKSLGTIRTTGDDRGLAPNGLRAENWGGGTEGIYRTGPGFLLNIRSTIEQQADWLTQVKPGYLLSYPSVLTSIAMHFHSHGKIWSGLQEVRSFGEVLEPEARQICEQLFGVPVVDMYSAQEVGYIALQCPVSGQYHIQSENLLVEVLNDDGHQCETGQIGKVVVTTLHNFAMPLLRYDIGDFAEVGSACPCGRGLPTLKKILGRQRGLITMPDGSRRWPVFDAGDSRPEELPPFYQFQVIQRDREQIDVLVVREAPLLSQEAERIASYMRHTLGAPFRVSVQKVDSISRSPSGKFEDFISEVC